MSGGPYQIILADPPWEYAFDWGNGSAAHTYPPMTVEQIKALPVKELVAAPNSWLFLWVTNPYLVDGSGTEVVRAWGFEPKTLITWRKTYKSGKPECGMGQYTRSCTEHLILGTKGKVKRADANVLNHFDAVNPRWYKKPHSTKPHDIHDLIIKLCGDLPRLEMFAREEAPGWDLWGNQAPGSITISEEAA